MHRRQYLVVHFSPELDVIVVLLGHLKCYIYILSVLIYNFLNSLLWLYGSFGLLHNN